MNRSASDIQPGIRRIILPLALLVLSLALPALAQPPPNIQPGQPSITRPNLRPKLDLRLPAESLFSEASTASRIMDLGDVSRFRTREIDIAEGATATVPQIASEIFSEIATIEQSFRRIPARALAKPVETEEVVAELPDSFLLAKSLRIVIADPAEAAASSDFVREYLADAAPAGALKLADLSPENRAGLDNFMKTELAGLPENDPIAQAARSGGEQAVLDALAAGKGEIEVVDTFEIPKRIPPMLGDALRVPDLSGNSFNSSKLRTLDSAAMRRVTMPRGGIAAIQSFPMEEMQEVEQPTARPTSSEVIGGTRAFTAKFLTGFTIGNSWRWERRWNYFSGFFRISLGAGYGFGLRVPIEVKGSFTPSHVKIVGERDRQIDVLKHFSIGIKTNVVPDGFPGLSTQRHIGAKQKVVLLHQARDSTPGGVVSFGHIATKRQVVVDDRAGSSVNIGVEEDFFGLLHPVGFKNGVRIDAPDDVGGHGIKAHVSRRGNALCFVLPEYYQRSIGELFLELLENCPCLIGRFIIDDNDFFSRHCLMNGGLNARPNRVFLVVGGNDDSHGRNAVC
jgi:hypothetical protein